MPTAADSFALVPSGRPTASAPVPSALAGLARHRDVVEAGQLICREGDHTESFHIVESGLVKLTRRTPKGALTALEVLGPGDVLGELSLMDGGARSASAEAITRVRLQSMSGEALMDLCERHLEVRTWLLRVLARRLRRATTVSAALVFTTVPERVARVLLDLGHRFGVEQGGSVAVSHGLTQAELAQLAGTTRESANRALACYARRGWISLGDRTLLIHDQPALRHGAGRPAAWSLAG